MSPGLLALFDLHFQLQSSILNFESVFSVCLVGQVILLDRFILHCIDSNTAGLVAEHLFSHKSGTVSNIVVHEGLIK